MVSQNGANRPVRSTNEVVGFAILSPPPLDVKAILGIGGRCDCHQPVSKKHTKYKGVELAKKKRKTQTTLYYRARLRYKGTKYDLGLFPPNQEGEIKAALAYDKAAVKLWGDQAITNQMAFPEDFKP